MRTARAVAIPTLMICAVKNGKALFDRSVSATRTNKERLLGPITPMTQ